jgi:hypothetical protein
MPIDKEVSRRWRRRIREILNAEWNPIDVPGIPEDEYDSHGAKLAAMIRDGATDEALVAYLRQVQTEHIGIPCSDMEKLRKVVRSIRAIGWMQ